MRVKTEEKRQAIIKAAFSAFCEGGYETTSMSQISARVGGSKATLYSYFSSKEELFLAVVLKIGGDLGKPLYDAFLSETDMRSALLTFARGYVNLVLTPEIVSLRRMIICEGGRSNLGKLCFENGAKNLWRRLAAYFDEAITQQRFRPCDAWRAAMHFKALCEADLFQWRIEGVIDNISPEHRNSVAESAVDVFLRAYAV